MNDFKEGSEILWPGSVNTERKFSNKWKRCTVSLASVSALYFWDIFPGVYLYLWAHSGLDRDLSLFTETQPANTQKWQVVVFLCMCVTEREKDRLFELEMQMHACIVVRGTHSLHHPCLRVRACAHTYPQKHSKRSNSRHPHAAAFYAICALRSMPSFGSIY